MGEREDRSVVVEKVRMAFSLGATFEVDGVVWVKPGVSFDIVYTGGLPSERQLQDGWDFLASQVESKGASLFESIRREAVTRTVTGPKTGAELPPDRAYRRPVPADGGSGERGDREPEDVEQRGGEGEGGQDERGGVDDRAPGAAEEAPGQP